MKNTYHHLLTVQRDALVAQARLRERKDRLEWLRKMRAQINGAYDRALFLQEASEKEVANLIAELDKLNVGNENSQRRTDE